MNSPFTTPDRPVAGFRTPGQKNCSPFGISFLTSVSGTGRTPASESPASPFTSPPPSRKFTSLSSPLSPSDTKDSPSPGGDSLKRGRPRANMITSLIEKGSVATNGAIQCWTCSRVFPREKSLQAHVRTHTGERPYPCDFPECPRSFCQSGQLKTHQRLHSGEKPFVCSAENCMIRFTHANRHCPDHPSHALIRDEQHMLESCLHDLSMSPEVQSWFQRYMLRRHEKTPNKTRRGLTQSCTKRSLYPDLENQYESCKRHTLVIGKLDSGDDTDKNESYFDKFSAEEPVYSDIDAGLKNSKNSKFPFQFEYESHVPLAVRRVSHEEIVVPTICASESEPVAEDLRVPKSSSTSELSSITTSTTPPSRSVPVSVIRRVGFSSPPPVSTARVFTFRGAEAGTNFSHSPQKVFILSSSMPSQRISSFNLRAPIASPIKSPRKQAALALIQLSASSKEKWANSRNE